jgi:predicted MFS family arabinose efflux permease
LGFFVISTILIFLIRPQPVEQAPEHEDGSAIRNLLRGRYLGFLALTFFTMIALYTPQPLTGNFLQNERGVNLGQIGTLLATRSLGVTLLNLSLGQLNARVGFLVGQVGVALFSLLIWKGSGMPAYMAGYFLMGAYQTARNLTVAQARAIIHATHMGRAYGLLETVNSLAVVAGPPIAGLLYAWDPALIYPISLGAIGLALAANLLLSPVRRKDVQVFENI